MSLALKHVQSDESHYAPFICQVCQTLPGLDALVTGSCSHAFCRSCMDEWTSKSSECPSCQVDLELSESSPPPCPSCRKITNNKGMDIFPLEKYQPLAYACMAKIQICCPHCTKWRGDYGKFKKHLTQCPFVIHRESSSVLKEYEQKNKQRKSPNQSPIRERVNSGRIRSKSPLRTKVSEETSLVHSPERLANCVTEKFAYHGKNLESSASMNLSTNSCGEEANLSNATILKEKGNARFNKREYGTARSFYDQALALVGDLKMLSVEDRHAAASLYCNRGATHGKERNYEKALVDYDYALQIAPDFLKAYSRKFKSLSAMGLLHEQKACLEAGVLHIPEEKTLLEDLRKIKQVIETMDIVRRSLQQANYLEAKDAGNFLMTITDHLDAVLLSAEADACVGKIDSAIKKCDFILNKDPHHILGLKTKGYVNMVAAKLDVACSFLKEAVKYDRLGNQAVKDIYKLCRRVQSDLAQGRTIVNKAEGSRILLKQAMDYYSSLIDDKSVPPRTPLTCLLRVERGEVGLQLQHYQLALTDARLAIETEQKNVRAWVVQCDSLIAIGRATEARDQLLEIKRDWGCDIERIKKAYVRANFECKVLECDKEIHSMVLHLVEKKKPRQNSMLDSTSHSDVSHQSGVEKRNVGRTRRKTAHGGMTDREIRRKATNRKDIAQNVDKGLVKKGSMGDRPFEHRQMKGRNSLPAGGRPSPPRSGRQNSPTPSEKARNSGKVQNGRWETDKGKPKQKERPVMSEEDARRRVSMI